MAKGMSTNNIKSANKINYYNYIYNNPLYIHNHKQYFLNTVKRIERIDNPVEIAYNLGRKYIAYLKGRETKLLNKLATANHTGEENLKIIANDIFIGSKKNKTEEIIKLLDKMFYMHQDEKVSVGRGLKKEGQQNNTFFKMSKTNEDGKRVVERIALELNENKSKNNSDKYNYEKTAQNLRSNKKYESIRTAINLMVDSMNEAFNTDEEIREAFKDLVDEQAIENMLAVGGKGYLRKYLELKVSSDAKEDELLKFLVDKMGLYSDIKGYFTEAVKIDYDGGIKEIFIENFKRTIGDEQKRKNSIYKKPDIIITGKTINGNITPLTISRKALTGDSIKFHEGSFRSVAEMLERINEKLAYDYLYLITNLAYYDDNDEAKDAKNMIVFIHKFMSYLLISGINSDKAIDKALYLVLTDAQKQTYFVPISSILETIINKESDINVRTSAIGAGGSGLMELWNYKLDTTKQHNKNGKRNKKGLRYNELSVDRKVMSQARTMVNGILTKNRRFEVNYTNNKIQTIISNGIITGD